MRLSRHVPLLLASAFLALWITAPAAHAANVTSSVTAPTLKLDQPGALMLTWTATGASKCTASGDWSGSKNVTGGTETVQVTKTSTFSITCESPTGPAKVFWTAPVPATSVAGYRVFSGPAPDQVARLVEVPGAANTSVQTQVSPGLTYFLVRSFDSNGLESIDSNSATKTVVADTSTSGVTVELNVRPPPPTKVGAQ